MYHFSIFNFACEQTDECIACPRRRTWGSCSGLDDLHRLDDPGRDRRRTQARLLLRPAPLLVPIIEEGRTAEDPLVRLALRQYLGPLRERGIDVLVLGCTHYPMLKKEIKKK